MYDSRSSHPRNHGSRYDRDEWTRPKHGAWSMSKREAIADQMVDDTQIDLPGLKRLGQIAYDHRWGGPIDREWDFFRRHNCHDDRCEGSCLERMDEWEVSLLGGPEGALWTENSPPRHMREVRSLEREAREDEEWEGVTDFLPLMSISEAYDVFGDDFTIEGPNAERVEPLKSEHYVRIHELAAEVGIESRDLIRHLRLEGEYVANHMSMVAHPVADTVRRQTDALVEKFGPRPGIRIDGLDALRIALLNPSAPARLPSPLCQTHSMAGATRPGAPRPGNNPFSIPRPRAHV